MKLLIILYCFILFINHPFCQINNDSCLSALELQPVFGKNLKSCEITGETGFELSVRSSNDNSLPNLPYWSMTQCNGYTNSTTNNANDIWFKLKTRGFIMYLYSFKNGLDTIHLNVWHGQDCGILQPSGCYTFDLVSQYEQMAEFCGDTINGEFTFLQFSGNRINKTGEFGFCLKGFPCSNVHYYGITNTQVINKNIIFNSDFTIYPNLSNGRLQIENLTQDISRLNEIELVDISRSVIFQKVLKNNQQHWEFDFSYLNPGIYFIQFYQDHRLVQTSKWVVY